MLDEQKDVIRKRVVDSLVEGAISGLDYVIQSEVRDVVKAVFADELKEAVRERLLARKEEVLSAVDTLAVRMGTEVAAALVEGVAENMKHSWNRKKVIEALFS